MNEAFLCNPVRTAFGRYGGSLAPVRADDLAAVPLAALKTALPRVDWEAVDDVIWGAANQSGEDNRNAARMAWLLADLPTSVSGMTVNRLCGSGMESVILAARMIRLGDAQMVVAGGAESMSRSPYVIAKADVPYARGLKLEDTTMGWRFVNPLMQARHGIDSMPETAENVAEEFGVTREDQDLFAVRSQARAEAARVSGRLAKEIVPVEIPRRKQESLRFEVDEHPRPGTTVERLAQLPTPFREGGTVTAGNASGINDGAAAMIVASEAAVTRFGLQPVARVTSSATAGVRPRIMGFGPAPATRKLLAKAQLELKDIDVIELNEAFAAQALAVIRNLGLADDAENVNPNGGAIALGHPLGASGARLLQTASLELVERGADRAIATMCIGVGQGIATLLERA